MRIIGAAALGAAVTPLLRALVDRFPVEGTRWRRNIAILTASGLGVATGLISVSCSAC